ncbi:MAG: HIT family protein [Rhodospirillales bacterium]|nr:HIT family protein [Rhodospirillales bacterium]
MPSFSLDPKLAADTIALTRWKLCRVLLMNDSNFPWLVLVPERTGLRDFHDLAPADLGEATAEIVRASRALELAFKPHKLNVAALGNVVRQLHIHVVARFTNDPAWPRPIWGVVPAKPYGEPELAAIAARLKAVLG